MNNELYHHGVQGQKWGKRNGPPYPLNAQGKAKLAKQKNKSNINSDDTEYGRRYNKYTEAGKKIVNTILSMAPGYSIASIGYKKAIAQGKQIHQDRIRKANGSIDQKTGLKLQSKSNSIEQDANRVNPGYQPYKKDTTSNCPYCCTAYDLRRRGFDVRAGQAKQGMTHSEIESLYKNGRFNSAVSESIYKDKYKDKNAMDTAGIRTMIGDSYLYNKPKKEIVKDIVSEIAKDNNSRGIISNRWNAGLSSGHVVSYEVNNGKLTIIDSQSNIIYNNPSDYLMHTEVGSVNFMRTDNLVPNYEIIKEKGVVVS